MAQQVIHKRSSIEDKLPSNTQIAYGELIVNYASGNGKSFITLRKVNDTLALFHEDDYWKAYIKNAIDSSKSSYELSIDDNGVVYCKKNGTEEGFTINDEGIVSLI